MLQTRPWLLCGALLLATPVLAHENSIYVETGLGQSIGTGDLIHQGPGSAGLPRYDVGDGTVVGLALGYQTIKGLRFELDFRQRTLDTGSPVSLGGRTGAAAGVESEAFSSRGEIESRTRLLNIIYFGQLLNSDWLAYVKLGLGEAKNRTDATLTIESTPAAPTNGAAIEYSRGSDREFAWSAGVGLNRPFLRNYLQQSRYFDQMEWGLDYQYTHLGDADTRASAAGDNLAHDTLAVHEISLRLRLHF